MQTSVKEPKNYVPPIKIEQAKKEINETVEEAGYPKTVTLNGVEISSEEGSVNLGMSSYNELIIGTHTTTTPTWTGNSVLPSASYFVSGYRFTYWCPYTGTSAGDTLTLTFQDNTSVTVNLYLRGSTRLSTHFNSGSSIDFVYLEDANVAGTLYTGCWPTAIYYSDTVNARGLQSYYERGKLYSALAPLYRYKICGYHDGKIVPIVITNQESTTQVNKVPTTISLDVQRGLVYYSGTATIDAANGTIGAQTLHESYHMTTAVYTFNESVATYTDVYLQGTYDATTGMFTLDNTQTSGNYRSYYVLAPRSSGDYYGSFVTGKYYWFVGASYSSANYIQLKVVNPVYYFDGDALIPVHYILPIASSTVLGGIKVGNNLSIDANGVLSATGGGGGSSNWSDITNKPTTINGYGITDAQKSITISSSEPTSGDGSDGDIWIVI